MPSKLLRKYKVWRFCRNPTRGHFVSLTHENHTKVVRNCDIYDASYEYRPEVVEWFQTCGPHFGSIGPTHGKFYFLDELDAVDFKLRFL